MPRRLSLPTVEMGRLELYLIYSVDGVWEEEWRALQTAGMDITEISKEDMDHALHGWTRPLVDNIGPPPNGLMRRLVSKECALKEGCPFYRKTDCTALSKKMPWCFEPVGYFPGNLSGEIIKLWREGVYVLIVRESTKDE